MLISLNKFFLGILAMRFFLTFLVIMLAFPLVAIAEETSTPMTKENCRQF